MLPLVIQTFLLIAIAWILGCVIGCLLHWWFGPSTLRGEPSEGSTRMAAAAVGTAGIGATAGSFRSTRRPRLIGTESERAALAGTAADPVPSPIPPLVSDAEPIVEAKTEAAPEEPIAEPAAAAAIGTTLVIAENDEKAKAADAAGDRPAALAGPRGGTPDDLKMVRGIGRQNEGRLNAMGTYHFDQIAAWSASQAKWVGTYLAFPGRIEREDWITQAAQLAKGEATEFSKRAASGKVKSSSGSAEKVSADFAGKKPRTMKAPRKAGADNLTLIDGVGNAIEKRLFELGIFHFDQIAKWTPENCVWIGNQIGFPGRAERENWVGESEILSAGGTTDHARRVEDGKIKTSRKSTDDEK
ncbi:MAG: hypothetical protein AAGH82_05590 [Pseudomonadota bacterium]